MKKLNIKYEIIKNIIEEVNRKQDSINFDGIFYLEIPINTKNGEISYLSRRKLFLNDGTQLKWVEQYGANLKKLFYSIKNNNFYFYPQDSTKKTKFKPKNEYKKFQF